MIKILNINTNAEYNVYSIRFYAVGNSVKGVLDACGDKSLPPDGVYRLMEFNNTLIQITSYDQAMRNLGIEYHKDNSLDFSVVIPIPSSNQS
jgi:hypothetical protein